VENLARIHRLFRPGQGLLERREVDPKGRGLAQRGRLNPCTLRSSWDGGALVSRVWLLILSS
jgi:hypothetical protein